MFAIYFPTLLYPPGYWGSQSWDLVIFWSEKTEIFEDQYFNLKIKPRQSGVRETYLQMHKIWKHQGMQWQVTNGICSKILLNLIKSYQEIDKAFTLSHIFNWVRWWQALQPSTHNHHILSHLSLLYGIMHIMSSNA